MGSFPQDSWIADPVAIAEQGAPIRVLVVEPDAASRRLICSILENETEDTVLCVDSSRLLPSIHEFRPDLVMLDVNATSRTAAWEYLGMKSGIATIITGYDATSLRRAPSVDGVLLIKPYDVEQLQIALDAAKSKIIQATTEIAAPGPSSNRQHSAERAQCLGRVAAERGETIVLINVKDILWLQSCGNHIRAPLGKRDSSRSANRKELPENARPAVFSADTSQRNCQS
jgi:CheY-like chemotaxis protein